MRRHGFQLPLDPHQVSAITVFTGLAAGCYAFQLMMVPSRSAFIALCIVYTVLIAIVLALDIKCSVMDPSDPGLNGTMGGEYYCSLCGVHVGKTSKHCRACDRCVEGFDHHCKWLNNCVGSRNYKYFFALVVSASALLVLQLAWALWLFISSFVHKDAMQAQVLLSYKGTVNYIGWQVMLMLYVLLLCGAVFMLAELLSFHLVLMSKEMTTYDFIVAQREQLLAGAAPGPSTAASLCSLLVKGLKCETCKGRVHDEDSAVARQKARVSLNPCTACTTKKLEGNPHTWMLQGRTSVPLPPTGSPSKPAALTTQAKPAATPLPAHLVAPGTPQTPTSVAAVEPQLYPSLGTPGTGNGSQHPVMEASAPGPLTRHLQPLYVQQYQAYTPPATWTVPAVKVRHESPQHSSQQVQQYPVTAVSGLPASSRSSPTMPWYAGPQLIQASPRQHFSPSHALAHNGEPGLDGMGARHLGSSPSARHSADRLPPLAYSPSPPSLPLHQANAQVTSS